MHDQDSSGLPNLGSAGAARKPALEPDVVAASLLSLLLSEYPGTLTYAEACLARVSDPEDRREADVFALAVRELTWDGLIRWQGDLLVPVRPVRQMARLGFAVG